MDDISEVEKTSSSFPKRALLALGRWLFLLLMAALTAGLLFESFPSPSHWMLAWLSLTPFVWGLSKTRGFWGACVYGGIGAFAFHALALYWVYYTCLHGGNMSPALSMGAWLGLSFLLSLQMAFWSGCSWFFLKLRGFFPLMVAIGWVALEWLHQTIAFYGLGFPWLMMGYTQWNAPEMIQLASYGGVYLISFLIVWASVSVGWAFVETSLKKGLFHIFLAAGIFLGVYYFGVYTLPSADDAKNQKTLLSVKTALMQPNIDQYKKWSPEFEEEILDTLSTMAAELEGKGVRLTVWPESVLPGDIEEEPYKTLVTEFSRITGSYQLVGSALKQGDQQYVGAFLWSASSNEEQPHYEKIKLVPFGEYIPFENLVRNWFSNVEVLNELGTFTPGTLQQNLLDMEGVKIGTTVCYESIFPQLWRAQNKLGAQLFVNITNDAWFFKTAAPYQHLAANVLRAVETGRPVLRAANTGFSAYIDSFGQIQDHSGLFTQETLLESVPLSVSTEPNIYTQWGDWWAWLCAALFFTVLISTVVFLYE